MKKLDLNACLRFQQVFYDEQTQTYSPYERIEDSRVYYPLAVIGEVGSLINAYGKRDRSLNDYSGEIEDEAVDVFLYLIMTPRIVMPNNPELLDGVKEDWDKAPEVIYDDRAFMMEALSLMNCVAGLCDQEDNAYTSAKFRKMFSLAKSIAVYVSGKDWQTLIDGSHAKFADIRTRPNNYTPDLRSKGGGYQNFDLLLKWIADYEVELPSKRVEFLGRMADLQALLDRR